MAPPTSIHTAAADTVGGMAKEVTLTLPDEVAEFLDGVEDASALVAEAGRGRMVGAVVRQQLIDAGFAITEEGIQRAREEMERIRAAITPKLRAEAAAVYAEVMRMRGRALTIAAVVLETSAVLGYADGSLGRPVIVV